MRQLMLGMVIFAVAGCSSEALATYTDVLELPTIAALQSSASLGTTNVNVDAYATPGDGGGGTFVDDGNVGAGGKCTVNGTPFTPDNGVIVLDSSSMHNHCWVRQFAGPVYLPWYGVKDATSSTCLGTMSGCDASAAITSALTIAPLLGNGTVSTGGRAVVIDNAMTPVAVGSHQTLTCDAPPNTYQNQTSSNNGYWTYENSLVVAPTETVTVSGMGSVHDCTVRPTWYVPQTGTMTTPNIPAQNANDLYGITNLFQGTPLLCSGQRCNLHDLFIVGFDTCFEANGAAFSVLHNIYGDCNVIGWMHNQGSGNHADAINSKQYMTQGVNDANGNPLDIISYPITAIANDGSGGVDVTISSLCAAASGGAISGCATEPYVNWQAGMPILAGGLGQTIANPTNGDFTASTPTIANIPACNGSVDGFCNVYPGYAITNRAGSTCVPTGSGTITVLSVTPDANGDGGGSAEMGNGTTPVNSACGTTTGASIQFSNSSVAPNAVQGLAHVSSYTQAYQSQTIDFTGASWMGPAFSNIAYFKGSSMLELYDTTNIEGAQYLCASGTPPICTPPTDFTLAGLKLAQPINMTTNLPNPTVTFTSGSVSQIPSPGIMMIGMEYMTYYVSTNAGSLSLQITARGQLNSSASTHTNGTTIYLGAPAVQRVVPNALTSATYGSQPSAGIVWLNMAAENNSATGGIAASFLNTTSFIGSGTLGYLIFSNSYRTWTSNTALGPAPDGAVTIPASYNSSTSLMLAVGNGFKLQPGMGVSDLTNSGNVSATCVVSSVSGTVVTLAGTSCSVSSGLSGDLISFTGCGFPTSQPWLGNCAATGLYLGNPNGGASDNLGTVVEWPHFYLGYRVGIHAYNSPALSVTNPVLDGGGGLGVENDPSAAGIWISGKGTKDQVTNGRIGGAPLSLLDEPTKTSYQSDGFGVENTQMSGDIVLSDFANLNLTGDHGNGLPLTAISLNRLIFAPFGADLSLTGNLFPQWFVEQDQFTQPRALACGSNILGSFLCQYRLPQAYTVETLPTCTPAYLGDREFVTDATTSTSMPTYLGVVAGAGTLSLWAMCNGTAWVAE